MPQRKINIVLFTFTCFCAWMELCRMWRSSSLSYIFLLWNLVLAWVPYLLSTSYARINIKQQKIRALCLLLFWVLFLPNGPYIITDLVHLRPRPYVPIWYDVLLVCAFAWHGMLLTLLSVRNVHNKLHNHLSSIKLYAGLIILFLSTGYGIYLGRFMRWNSWDVFIRPVYLLHCALVQIIHPLRNPKLVMVSLILGILLSFSYAIFYLIESKPQSANEII
jgi:uncharacterized membrane protein